MHHNNYFPNPDFNRGARGQYEQQHDHNKFDFGASSRTQEYPGGNPFQDKKIPRSSNSPRRLDAQQLNYTSRSMDLLQNKFPGSEDELIKLFEECENEIAFWRAKFEKESEKTQRLQASINEIHLELEEKEERIKALTTINKNLKEKLAGNSCRNEKQNIKKIEENFFFEVGDTAFQYLPGDNKALMEKLRDQSLQIEELIQKNELFNKQIENMKRNKPSSHDFNSYDITDNRKRERELLDKISQLSMEMESMKLKHAQEKNELLRSMNHASPLFEGGFNNSARNHQRDQNPYENNIDRLSKNISHLQSLNSGLKNDKIRELLEDINEMKKEMQRYVNCVKGTRFGFARPRIEYRLSQKS